MFTINCMVRVPDDQIDLVKQDLAGLARFWAERAYGEKMIATASKRRMVHLEQRMAKRRPPQRTSGEGAGRDARAIAGIGKS